MLCIPIWVALVVTISDNVPTFTKQSLEFSAWLEQFFHNKKAVPMSFRKDVR